jgi:AraC-like DNA-binding protein
MKPTRPALKLEFSYSDTSERRCVSLEPDGILCVPVLGFDAFKKTLNVAPMHVHAECLEISLCLRGDLEFELEGQTYPFRPDTIFVSRPDERHSLKYYPRSMSKYWLLFRIPKGTFPLLGLPQDEAKWLRKEMLALPRSFTDTGHRVRSAFQRLFHVYDSAPAKTPQRRGLLRNAALSLFIALVETAQAEERILPMTRLSQIVEEIRREPGRDYPVDELARRTALSPTGLLQRFKRLTGFPPHAFILSCRIEKAKQELEKGSAPIAIIADNLGFPSAQHFATIFKRVVGKTPSEWRMRS